MRFSKSKKGLPAYAMVKALEERHSGVSGSQALTLVTARNIYWMIALTRLVLFSFPRSKLLELSSQLEAYILCKRDRVFLSSFTQYTNIRGDVVYRVTLSRILKGQDSTWTHAQSP